MLLHSMQSNLVIFIVLCIVLVAVLAFVGTKYLNKEDQYQQETFKFKTEYLITIGALVIFIVIFGLKL